jgi:conjugal transfer pilin signal peptidase TrbI
VKQIAGVSGDKVEVMVKSVARMKGDEMVYTDDTMVFINSQAIAMVKPVSRSGRPMQALSSGVIPAGHVYLNANHPDSFDSRYNDIELVKHEKITGRIIWMW